MPTGAFLSLPPAPLCSTDSRGGTQLFSDPSFGFAGLAFLNASAATYTWFRNQDQSSGAALVGADHVLYTRSANCSTNAPAPAPPTASKSSVGWSVGLVVVLLIAAAAGVAYYRQRQAAPAASAPAEVALAEREGAPLTHGKGG